LQADLTRRTAGGKVTRVLLLVILAVVVLGFWLAVHWRRRVALEQAREQRGLEAKTPAGDTDASDPGGPRTR